MWWCGVREGISGTNRGPCHKTVELIFAHHAPRFPAGGRAFKQGGVVRIDLRK